MVRENLCKYLEVDFEPKGERTPQASEETFNALKDMFKPYARFEDLSLGNVDNFIGGPWSRCSSYRWEFADGMEVNYSFRTSGMGSFDPIGKVESEKLSVGYFLRGVSSFEDIKDIFRSVRFYQQNEKT